MDMNQPPPGKAPDLTDLSGKVSVRLIGHRPWLWRFLGICLLAAVVGGPASLAGGVYQETNPSANVQDAWLTASVSVVDTITFVSVANQIVGATVPVSASSSSPLPDVTVTLQSDTASVCTLGGSTRQPGSTEAPVTTIAVGLCKIMAYDDADSGAQATLLFQVQAAQTITFGPPPDVTVGAPVTLSASASSGLPVSFSSGAIPVCTVQGSAVTTVAAGLCTITASQAGSTDYAAAPPVTQLFQVNPAAQTITFGPLPDVAVGAPVTLSASASSGLPVSFSSGTTPVCTVAGSVVTTVAAGPCTITASQGGSARYAAAPDVSRSFQVNPVHTGPAVQTITFGQPPDATAGAPVTLSASASSGLPVSFSSGTTPVCTVAGSVVTTVAAGPCTITASQGGSARYAAAPDVSRSFQVNPVHTGPAVQTITFGQPPDATAGAPVTLSASASSGLPVSFRSDTTPVCTVAGSAVTTVAAGPCTITASQGGSARYAAAPDVSRSFQVNPVHTGPAVQTITFGQPADATAGAPVTLSASASSGLPVSFSSGTTPVCTVAGSAVTTVAAGPCTITASQGGSARYAAAPDVSRSFQVNPVHTGSAVQTITFGQPPDATVGAPVTLSASASSGLPVSFRSDTTPVCTVAGSAVTTVAAGPCTITASQGGSARYAAATDVLQSFQVNPVPSKAAGVRVILLAAVILAAAAATLVVRRRRLRSHPPPTGPAPNVRAVPDTGPPGLVSVHNTGTDATHTVRIEPSPGTSITTIEEARP